jgi:hypothetical protein
VPRLGGGGVRSLRQRGDAPGELRRIGRSSSREPMHERRSAVIAALSGRRSSRCCRRSVPGHGRGYATPAVRAAQPLSVTRTRGERGRSDACTECVTRPGPSRDGCGLRLLSPRGDPEPQTLSTVERLPGSAVSPL